MLPSAERLSINSGGILIGRSSRADVMVDHPAASRQHAIVVEHDDAPRVVVLGRGWVEVNQQPVEHERRLGDGDRLGVPGMVASIVVGASGAHALDGWAVRTRGGARFGLTRSTFVIGSSATADLRIDGLPPEAVRLVIGAEVELVAAVAVTVAGAAVAPGARTVLRGGAWVAVGDEAFHVGPIEAADAVATATELVVPALPTEVTVEFLPRGGRLRVTIAGRPQLVFLSEKRCDLVAALLKPPPPFVAGDFIPDDTLLPRLWPGRAMSRVDLNTLVHRTRQDLTPLGIDPGELVARAPGGGATRFGLAPGASVRFE